MQPTFLPTDKSNEAIPYPFLDDRKLGTGIRVISSEHEAELKTAFLMNIPRHSRKPHPLAQRTPEAGPSNPPYTPPCSLAQSLANLDEQDAIYDSYQTLRANCLPLPRTNKPNDSFDPCRLTRSEISALEAEDQKEEAGMVVSITQDEAIDAMLQASGVRWESVGPAIDRAIRRLPAEPWAELRVLLTDALHSRFILVSDDEEWVWVSAKDALP